MTNTPPNRDRLRRWLGRLLLSLLAMCVAVLVCEGALRLLDRARPVPRYYPGEQTPRESQNFVAAPDTGWKMRPDHRFRWDTDGRSVEYRSDLDGFRIEADGGDDPSGLGADPLVVCGDSFAFGTGVSLRESFGAILADGLGLPQRNLAMPGFGVDQVACSVREQAFDRPASLLLVALYPEDFERSFTAFREKEGFAKPRFELATEGLRPQTSADRPWLPWRWCVDRSRVVAALRIAERRIGRAHGRLGWWRLNEALLDQVVSDSRTADVPVVLAFIPSRLWRPFPALRAWAAQNDVMILDPVGDSDLDPSGLYYERDLHLNAEGHRQLGEWFLGRVRARFPDLGQR